MYMNIAIAIMETTTMSSKIKITCKCGCGRTKMVRTADVKRGWGLYFNKSCKAIHQTKTKGSKPKRYKGGIKNAPADVRAKTLIKAFEEDRISFEFFAHAFPISEYHMLDRDLVWEVEDELCAPHPFSESAGW